LEPPKAARKGAAGPNRLCACACAAGADRQRTHLVMSAGDAGGDFPGRRGRGCCWLLVFVYLAIVAAVVEVGFKEDFMGP
jgi:hypothetical protein